MLKALELVGFKSFADKTRFEFPSGITVVVGPNGSGKSNIVDAIKWVLGEQSVKSLRGKEMADVIFNGSGARRGLNSAEITLTLDNSKNVLAIDTPEVHITRRVYRSGEGEYLINRQPCRLRDIRDLLSGTGMGTQAYSVIEQGKVDVLLQSSPRDRRIIFEEAAGISRFKAKKIEALRRLERVDQNLLRLSDIVDEVENRLRSVRSQAKKAQRYKQYSDRLQELRTQVGLVDWRRLSDRLEQFESELQALNHQRDAAVAEAEACEARLLDADTRIGDVNESIRQSEARMAANRERIAGHESTMDHERAQGRELEQEIQRQRQRLCDMTVRAGDLQQQLRDTAEAVQAATEHHQRIARRVAEGERSLTELIARLDQLRSENEQLRIAYMDQMRSVAALSSQISALESEAAAALAAQQRCHSRLAEVDGHIGRLAADLDSLVAERESLARAAEEQQREAVSARSLLAETRGLVADLRKKQGELEQRRSAMAGRISVLEELDRKHEGVSPGVKDVLALAETATDGPFGQVRGLVADLLRASVEAASLVEAALGDKAQLIVAAPGDPLLDYLKRESSRLAGRVGFIWLDDDHDPASEPQMSLAGRPGVIGRADRFVETDVEFAPLAKRLLGRFWVVEELADALALAGSDADGLSFVTLSGELLAADGTLLVGPNHGSTGLISRRSELRALRSELDELNGQLDDTSAAVGRAEEQAARQEERLFRITEQHQESLEALARHGHKITAAEERQAQLDEQRKVLKAEWGAASAQHETATEALAQQRTKHRETQTALAETEKALAELNRGIEQLEADRQARGRDAVDSKVELAKSEERLENLRSRMQQFEESQQERLRSITEGRQQLARCLRRAETSRWNILGAESEVAELYLRKESVAAETVALINHREAIRAERSELTERISRVRSKVRKIEEGIHNQELGAGDVRHQRSTLADRLREDYGIELSELEHEPTDEEQHEREAVQEEIDDLRRKINNIGNVNLEALEELEQLEARYTSLSDQYTDLASAKASLERIIDKINTDSRRLFTETLDTVRGHFKTLFRDLFGGGQADIILDQGEDILESGIEIVARPPGKEPRSISLLSGGEKTLTCVALLLAIFRSRPSPFCVLDEVDAALDEANIDRFTGVLRGFLAWTQFIIVTHSKKTMTCANTIYGVTMQESGVSKQVSVRFDDVSETGEILSTAGEVDEAPPVSLDEDEQQAA